MQQCQITVGGVELCTFDIIQTPFTDVMFENFYSDNMNLSYIERSNSSIQQRQLLLPTYADMYPQLYNTYQQLLTVLGTTDQFAVNAEFDYTNRDTNLLHRVFTTAIDQHTYAGVEFTMTEQIESLVHQINDYCHELEMYITNNRQSTATRWLELAPEGREQHEIKMKPYELDADTSVDVFAMYEILGKAHECAYLDMDTPTYDITGKGYHTYPGIMIDFWGDFKRIWNSAEYQQWSASATHTVGRIPVGRIIRKNLNIGLDNQDVLCYSVTKQ